MLYVSSSLHYWLVSSSAFEEFYISAGYILSRHLVKMIFMLIHFREDGKFPLELRYLPYLLCLLAFFSHCSEAFLVLRHFRWSFKTPIMSYSSVHLVCNWFLFSSRVLKWVFKLKPHRSLSSLWFIFHVASVFWGTCFIWFHAPTQPCLLQEQRPYPHLLQCLPRSLTWLLKKFCNILVFCVTNVFSLLFIHLAAFENRVRLPWSREVLSRASLRAPWIFFFIFLMDFADVNSDSDLIWGLWCCL